ncbi:T9SS sorting signal type C domain-containing protein [Flavobacterium sp. FlaQc-47]|uniref:T9SS sorting signal type C domain-containing protein n=1 Tax=Flavobacterium sp. FlaQc-47 TaxID=3374180 RepID=UPI003756DB8D
MIQKLLLFVRSLFLKFNSSSSERSFIPGLKLLCVAMFFVVSYSNAATFFSRQSGNWNDVNTWSSTSGGGSAGAIPMTSDDVIIENSNLITVTANARCKSLVFNTNTSTLTVNSGFTLIVTNAITINSSNSSFRTIAINGGGTLSVGSVIVGLTTSDPTVLITTTLISNITTFNVSGNITLNSTRNTNTNNAIFNLESGTLDITGQIRAVNENTNNNPVFSMASGAQSGTLLLANATAFSQTGPGTSTLNLNGTGSTVNYDGTNQSVFAASPYNNLIISGSGTKSVLGNITVNKDFRLSGGTFVLNNASSFVFTILGDYTQTAGVLDFNAGTSGTTNIYLAGNLSNTAGAASITTTGQVKNGIITFNGAGTQTINIPTAGAAIWAKYIVNAGSTLKLASNLTLNTADPASQADWTGDLIVNNTGTIDFGTFQVSSSGGVAGSAIVTVNSGANVITANVNGLNGSVSSTNLNPTFSPLANYTFNGSSAQVTGALLPATVNNLSIANTAGVTLSKSTTVSNDFSLASGAKASLNSFTHSAKTLTYSSNGQNAGSWGSTASAATNKSAAYFGTTASGILNASTAACTAGYWTGATSTDWNTASNWCGNVVPTNSTNVIIPTGTPNMPTIAAGITAVVNNLTINASASLTLVNSATSLLNISGNFASSGTFNAGAASTISFIGGTQSVAGVTYGNLTLSGGTKTFAGNTIITNNLVVNSGAVINLNTITTHTAGTLTLNGSGPLSSTWGASGSGAANTNDTYFTGSGRITINGTPAYPAIDKNFASYAKGIYGKVANSYAENASPLFSAPYGTVFINVDFASYGLPSGLPAPFTLGTCDAVNSRTIATTFLGNTTATIPATNAVFGDPCYSTVKRLSIQATYTEPICNNTSPGLITGSDPTGGNGTYAFSWSVSTTGATSGFTAAPGVNNVRDYTPGLLTTTTWYKRTVTSGMYTSETIVIVPVNQIPVAPTTITAPVSICAGNPTTLTVSGGNKGGNGGYAQWFSDSCGGTLVGEGDSITLTPTANTTYYVRYKNGCTTTTCISTTVTSTVSATVAAAATDVCTKSTIQTTPLAYTSATGTPNRYSIVWSNTPTNSFVNVTDIAITNPISISVPANTAAGTYTGTISFKNAGNCSSFGTTFTVTINPLQTAPTVTTVQPTCAVNTGTITITAPTGAGTTYSINGSTYTNTTGIFAGLAVGSYNVTAKNSSGCTSPITVVNIIAATVKTWTGATSTRWDLATNWSPSGIPSAADCVVIPNVTRKPIISGTGVNGAAQALTINANASLSVFSDNTLTVTNAINVATTGSLVFENHSGLLQLNDSPTINTGNITYKRITPQIRVADFTYWSTPVSPQTLLGVSPLTLFDKYFGFDGDNWVGTNSSTVMTVGKGYIIRGPQTYSRTVKADYEASFIGVPNNGDLSGETLAANKFYLIGNPYPSALDAKKFLAANTFLNGTLYFWTHNTPVVFAPGYLYSSNDYAVYNLTGGTGTLAAISGSIPGNNAAIPSGKIAAGQSFFASAGTSGGTVTFNNSMRSGSVDNTQFFKPGTTSNGTEANRVWLNMTNDGGAFKQLLVGYVDGASNEFDKNYDGLTFDGNDYIDFYSLANDNKYVIQGRALPFSDADTVPLGYRTTIEGDFTIAIDGTDGSLSNQNIYLEDKTTGKVHDLTAGNYTFKTATGNFTDRFVLRYTNKTLGIGDVENADNNLIVSVKDKVVKVTSTKENIKQVTIFDITGKLLYDKNKVGTTELQLQNLPFSNQVLLVKVILENNSAKTKKIIFK